jgi:hypothetical protein
MTFQVSTAAAVAVSSPVLIPSGKPITDLEMLNSELRLS